MSIYSQRKETLSANNGYIRFKYLLLDISPFLLILMLCFRTTVEIQGQSVTRSLPVLTEYDDVIPGAGRTWLYIPLLGNRSVGLVCNHTSVVGNTHLVDTLIGSGIKISAIFSPEHGFRGSAEAGAEIDDSKDTKTGLPVISLYGKKKKPASNDLKGVDVILFDIQDVGVRFYTYISTLALVMEAAAESDIPVIVADRPNPNGFYIDGPVLDTVYRSFVGMHPVPIVYGMTIGEYALMINGEGWLNGPKCDLTVIPLENYKRSMMVKLPISPSPNLPTWQSVYLYPSLCLFEGTIISVGRGTDKPFQIIGHPEYHAGTYRFIPMSIPGVSDNPPYANQVCQGLDLTSFAENYAYNAEHFNLEWLMAMHVYFKDRKDFFSSYFEKLAGTDRLRQSIISGETDQEIRSSWDKELASFMQIRKKYLLYPDFD